MVQYQFMVLVLQKKWQVINLQKRFKASDINGCGVFNNDYLWSRKKDWKMKRFRKAP